VEEEKEKDRAASAPTPSVDSLKIEDASRLIGIPGPGDISPPTAEIAQAPASPTDPSTSTESLQPDSSIIIRPDTVADIIPLETERAPSKEIAKALSVADLIALTDLINDSAVCTIHSLSPDSLTLPLRWREKKLS
jgi:hypothetical protein